VQDFDFMGGSLGMAAADAIITGAEAAVARRSPFVLFAASGGARMQEGIISLMQLPRTTIAVHMVKDAGLPYIVILTNPTTGGVTASYAMLGDVQIAEPGALVGFAGPRVIEQTIREQLPEGFQRAEYLRDHGMVDIVVHRHKLRETVARLCRLLMKLPPPNYPHGDGEASDEPGADGNGEEAAAAVAPDQTVEQAPVVPS
jgi:acetyl-CoA carboxylase carboxyl transferase subunit beta